MNGYGQFFLLLLAIGLIFFATSGKAWDIIQILKGNGPEYGPGSGSSNGTKTDGTPKTSNPTNPKEWDKAGSGSGGVTA